MEPVPLHGVSAGSGSGDASMLLACAHEVFRPDFMRRSGGNVLNVADVHLDGSYCGVCGRRIHEAEEAADAALEARRPCPVCGSFERNRSVSVADSLTFHESLSLVQRQPPGPAGGKGKRVLEAKSGEFQSEDGTWSTVEQIVDRLRRRYRKYVRRSDGTVTRDEDGPLDEHQGYGSAKYKKEKGPGI